MLAAEGAASLKLIDKGVAKEALAFLVLFQVGGRHAGPALSRHPGAAAVPCVPAAASSAARTRVPTPVSFP